ncbi:MAG: hypothetical protein ACRDTJ_22470 [Pseudonocardiaceae bacterium]
MRFLRKSPASQPVGVCLEGVRDALESTRSGQIVLGIGETDGPMMLELDFAHTLIVGDAGAGTSVLLRSVLGQALAHGAEVVLLDRARRHSWVKGHPDVRQVWAVDAIAAELVGLAEELERRQTIAASEILSSRRLVLAIECRAGLAEMLQERWEELRDPGDPIAAPAVAALAELEWASPMLGIHLVSTTHAGARVPAAAREAYGVRIVSGRVGTQAWPMFTGGLSRPLAAQSRQPGRFWVVSGATTAPLIALHLTELEAQHLPAALLLASAGKWGAA